MVNQTFDMEVRNANDEIKIVIWDQDVVESDLVAALTIKTTELIKEGGVDDWF